MRRVRLVNPWPAVPERMPRAYKCQDLCTGNIVPRLADNQREDTESALHVPHLPVVALCPWVQRHAARLRDEAWVVGVGHVLSLIHISEPTRQAEISYAVFC